MGGYCPRGAIVRGAIVLDPTGLEAKTAEVMQLYINLTKIKVVIYNIYREICFINEKHILSSCV